MVETRGQSQLKQLGIIGIILAILGLGISVYSVSHHLEVKASGTTEAFCNINATFNCDDVANSKYSEDPYGNPLGIYGAGYFLGLITLIGVALMKEQYRKDALHAYSALVIVGVLTSIVLGSISYFAVGTLCLTCIGIYVVTLVQGATLFFLRDAIPGAWSFKSVSNGGTYALVTLVLVIGAFQFLKPVSSPHFIPDNPRTAEEVQGLLKQLEKHQEQITRNQEIIQISRSAYSGLGEDYRKGPENAKVTIIEFADFQCPACSYASKNINQIMKEYGAQVQVVFKNYPLDQSCNHNISREFHAHACEAAILARCAGRYGKFWEFHDKVFENQSKIDAKRLELWALEVGLQQNQIDECREAKDIVEKIQEDIKQADALGITGTPAIYINGMKADVTSIEGMRRTVSNLLRSQ